MPVRSMRARAKRRAPPALGNSVAQGARFAEHDVNRSDDENALYGCSGVAVSCLTDV